MIGVAGPKPPGPKYGQPVAPNLNVKQICPNCRSDPPNIIEEYSKGDLVCGDCGTILGDRIVDTRSEWRTFAGDEGGDDPSRVGDAGNALLGSNQLDTIVSGRDGHSGLSASLQRAMLRGNAASAAGLAGAAAAAGGGMGGGKTVAQISAIFGRIADMADKMQLGQAIVQRAQHIYKIAEERRVLRNKNEMAAIGACILLASRAGGANRSLAELGKATGVTKKELGQLLNIIRSTLQAERAAAGGDITTGQADFGDSVDSLLRRIVNFLDLPLSIYNAAKHITALALEKTGVGGRSPVSVTAGVLWFTCVLFGRDETAKEIGDRAEVSESTTKLVCKDLAKRIDDLIRPEWKEISPAGYASLVSLGRLNEAPPGKSRASTPKPVGAAGPSAGPSGSVGASANGTGANGVAKSEPPGTPLRPIDVDMKVEGGA